MPFPLLAGAAAGSAGQATQSATTLVGQTTNATAGLIGGIASSFANNRLQKQNNAELERLKRLKKLGALGLSPIEQRTMTNQLMTPMQDAAAAGKARAEQMAVAGQANGASGADLSRLRTEQSQQVGRAGQQVRAQVMSADEARRQAQLAEYEARLQSQAEMKANDISTITNGITNGMRAAGQAAAAPVGVQASAVGSRLPPDTLLQLKNAGWSDASISGFENYLVQNPQALSQMLNASPNAVAGTGAYAPTIGANVGTVGTGPTITPEQLAAAYQR